MTIKYCDYANGNDTTGDGSRTNPYKTITRASEGLTGGDEVRCAKSAAPSALSGTLTWTNGSATVATSVDLTGVLAAKDFIRKTTLNAADYDVWWEISSITSTTITLASKFRGYSDTTTGLKLGVTDTGGAAATTTHVQEISASGSSVSSKLKISGGWDLSLESPEQTGLTMYWQSGTNRYGYGLYSSSKNYISLKKLGMLRYYYSFYIGGYSYDWDYIYSLNPGSMPISFSADTSGSQSINHHYSATTGTIRPLYILSSDCIVKNSAFVGGYGYQVSFTVFENCVFDLTLFNFYAGISFFINCDFRSSPITSYTHGIVYMYNPVNLPSLSTFGLSAYYYNKDPYLYDLPLYRAFFVKNLDGDGIDYTVTIGGIGKSNVVDARSGKCLEIIPGSTSYYHIQDFQFPANVSTARSLKFYAKKSAAFDGSADAAILFMGTKITDWTAISNLSTNYQEYSIIADADDTPLSGVYVLRIRVLKGSAGSIYIDDLSHS